MKKSKIIKIVIILSIIFLLMQNMVMARYYEVLDTISIRFIIEENLNTGVENNYENKEI